MNRMKVNPPLSSDQMLVLSPILCNLGIGHLNLSKGDLKELYERHVSIPHRDRSDEFIVDYRLSLIGDQILTMHRLEVYKTIAASSSLQGRLQELSERILNLHQPVSNGGAA